MKKIIFNIVQSNIKGGLENVYLDYSKILHEDFELVCITSEKFVHLDELKKLGIKTETLNIKGHFDILSAIKFFLLVKKYSPELVIAHNGRSFALINLYNKIFRKRNFKIAAISHGGNPKRLVNFDYIITVAEHLTDNIKKKYKNISQDRIFTIHNGIKVNSNYNPKNKIKNKNFTFGSLSRLSPEKNIITAIKAFKIFLKDVPDARLNIAGDGPDLCNLTEIVKNENLTDNVSFIGHVNNIEKFFNEIDLFIHPAIKEAFGLVILEAFNYYTPVIGSNSGGLREIINNKKNGYLYDDPMSEQDLYKMMHDYYFNKIKDREVVVKNAKKDLENKFSIEITKNKLKTVIKSFFK